MDSEALDLPDSLQGKLDALNGLLQQAGTSGALHVEPLPGGRNNRVFRVDTEEGPLLLKTYFYTASDPRDRLRHEYDFCTFARNHGITSVAHPLAADKERRWAVYDFVPGEKLSLDQIDARHVRMAADFVLGMSAERHHSDAANLLPASEACFSISEHVQKVRSRIERLTSMDELLPVDRLAREFVAREVLPAFDLVNARLLSSGMNLDHILPMAHRCLSPSDFGFHNAIFMASGSFCFVDFEFAGWDDPAKLISDFANQPDMLLPHELSAIFRDAILQEGSFGDELAERLAYVEPLYQIKWACICLNDFLPFGRSRRSFTGGTASEEEHKISQLERARCMTDRALCKQG